VDRVLSQQNADVRGRYRIAFPRSGISRRVASGLAAGALLLSGHLGAGAEDEPSAHVTCVRALSPGRVRCDVEARAPTGAIRWGDVEIVQTPSFASALKGRVGPRDATTKDDATWRWGIALVARQTGAGEIVVRVRLVLCAGERCGPKTLDAKATMVVGG
jgi:hypothetical protein